MSLSNEIALLVFNIYLVVKCAVLLFITAAVDSFKETTEEVLVNWGAVEETVVVFVDDIVGGWGPHLAISSLYLYPVIIYMDQYFFVNWTITGWFR